MMTVSRHSPRVFSKSLAVLGASLLTGAHLCYPAFADDFAPPPNSYIYQLSVNQTKQWMLNNPLVSDESYLQCGFWDDRLSPPNWAYTAMEYQGTVEYYGKIYLRFSGTMLGTSYNRFQYRFASRIQPFTTQSTNLVHLDWEWMLPYSVTNYDVTGMGFVFYDLDSNIRPTLFESDTGVTTLPTPCAFYDSLGLVHTFPNARFYRVVTGEWPYVGQNCFWRVDTNGLYRWEHKQDEDTVTTFTVLCACPKLIYYPEQDAASMATVDIQQSVKQIVSYLGQGGDLYGDAAITYQAEREVLQEYRGEYEDIHHAESTLMSQALTNVSNGNNVAQSAVLSGLEDVETADYDIFSWMVPLLSFLLIPSGAVLIAMILRG